MLTQAVYTLFDILYGHAHILGHLFLAFLVLRYKLVERWVEQTNIYRTAIHGLEDTDEVVLLERQEFLECFLTSFK